MSDQESVHLRFGYGSEPATVAQVEHQAGIIQHVAPEARRRGAGDAQIGFNAM